MDPGEPWPGARPVDLTRAASIGYYAFIMRRFVLILSSRSGTWSGQAGDPLRGWGAGRIASRVHCPIAAQFPSGFGRVPARADRL